MPDPNLYPEDVRSKFQKLDSTTYINPFSRIHVHITFSTRTNINL